MVRTCCRAPALVAALALVPAIASAQSAQSAQDQAAAEGLFSQGRDLMMQGKLAEACAKFAESERLDPSAGTLLNLATCYERDGKIASAWVTYKEAATAAQRADEPDRVRLARDKANDLQPKLPTLAIVVPATSEVPGLVVKRDGEEVGHTVWGTPIPVDPGAHPVSASAPGYVEWKAQAQVEGPGAKATIEVPPLIAAPKPPPPPPPPPAPEGSTGTAQRVIGIVAGSVGIVGLGAGSLFGVVAKSKLDDSKDHCTGSVCDATGVSALSDARGAATLSTIGFVAGGALVVGGIVLFLTAPRSHAPTVGLAAGAWGAPGGLTLMGAW